MSLHEINNGQQHNEISVNLMITDVNLTLV